MNPQNNGTNQFLFSIHLPLYMSVTFHVELPDSWLEFALFSSVYNKMSHAMFTGKCQAVSSSHEIYLRNFHAACI